jgi:hypothetical protein
VGLDPDDEDGAVESLAAERPRAPDGRDATADQEDIGRASHDAIVAVRLDSPGT